jgi:hypothetical protein
MLSVLRITDNDYPFGIFKLFLCWVQGLKSYDLFCSARVKYLGSFATNDQFFLLLVCCIFTNTWLAKSSDIS